MNDEKRGELRERWARLRFAVVAPLMASPPARGELGREIEKLTGKPWKHPKTGAPIFFSASTIERWYHKANKATDPVGELAARVRKDAGEKRSLSPGLIDALVLQYQAHPSWSYKLHADNLTAQTRVRAELGDVPSVSTVRRFMKSQGLVRVPRRKRRDTQGAARAEQRFFDLEVRSFEVEYVHGLWHLDFHQGSRRVLDELGRWRKPHLLGILDDRSRLCCHAQWYLGESAQALVHGLAQAFHKRGLPRAILWDNGAAMRAEEVLEGLRDLGIDPQPTLCYSPYQNGKQESFWVVVEGRLMAMLEGEAELSLEFLNEATLTWIEADYNRGQHKAIGTTPLSRYLAGPDVGRECPSSLELRRAFRRVTSRRQRRSDGTVTIERERFEVPSRFSHLDTITVRYASWDLSLVEMVDPRTRVVLARLLPVDLAGNADGRRRKRERELVSPSPHVASKQPSGMAPLLRQMIEQRRASGLPPAYLPGPNGRPDREQGEEEVQP
jgi:transposase InsO family protein